MFRWGVVLQKILLVGAWFFGVIFILTSLGAFLEESVVAGLLMLVGGVLLLPPVKRLILGKKTNLSSGKITAVGSILVFVSFFLATLGDDTNSVPLANSSVETKQDVVEPEPTKEVVKEKEPVEVATIPVENKPIVEPEPTIEKTKINSPVVKSEKTFGITADEYRKRLKEVSKELSSSKFSALNFNEDSINFKKGAVDDSFTIQVNNKVFVEGVLDKNGDIKSVTSKDGNMPVMLLLSVKALNPSLTNDEATIISDKLIEDIFEEPKSEDGREITRTTGNVKYTILANKAVGLQAALTPANNIKTASIKSAVPKKSKDIDPVKARAILAKVEQEVKEAKNFNLKDKAALGKKSRRMRALLEEETAPFGDKANSVGLLCDLTRRQAFMYWLQVIKADADPQRSKVFLKYYEDSKKPCLDAIKEFEK